MISTAPLAMLVIEGGVTRVRLRMVGWIENGLTPLSVSSYLLHTTLSSYITTRMDKDVLYRFGRTSTNIHFNLNNMIDRWTRI